MRRYSTTPYHASVNCYVFGYQMIGQQWEQSECPSLLGYSQVEDIDSLAAGSLVFFAQSPLEGSAYKHSRAKHAALYLGYGLFLSKLGFGDLVVMDTQNIHYHYRTDEVWS